MNRSQPKQARSHTMDEVRDLCATWLMRAYSDGREEDPSLSQTVLAKLLGVSQTSLSRWLIGERPLHAHVVVSAPRPVALSWLRQAADYLGCLVVEAPDAGGTALDHYAGLGAVGKESGEVLAAYSEALADGYLSADDSKRLVKELDDLVQAACALRERAKASLRARGERVSLRPVEGGAA